MNGQPADIDMEILIREWGMTDEVVKIMKGMSASVKIVSGLCHYIFLKAMPSLKLYYFRVHVDA